MTGIAFLQSLQSQHLLAASVTAFVAGDQAVSMPDLDMQRMHPRAGASWHRIEVGLDRHAALLVHQRAERRLSAKQGFTRRSVQNHTLSQ